MIVSYALLGLLVMGLSAGFGLLIQYEEYLASFAEFRSFVDFFFSDLSGNMLLLLGTFVGLASFFLLLTYLWHTYLRRLLFPELDGRNPGNSSELASMERQLLAQIQTVRRELEEQISAREATLSFSDGEDFKEIAEGIVQEKIDKQLSGQIVETLGERVAQQAADHAKRKEVRQFLNDLFNSSRTRIGDQAKSAEDAARLFRWVGLFLAFAGIILAGVNLIIFYTDVLLQSGISGAESSAASDAGSSGDANALESKVVTDAILGSLRTLPFTFPFIILAEVLALIMFRYQSKSLEMMRYFANEVTTLSLRQAGALLIAEHGTKKQVEDLSIELLKSERNIIMRKDEKTIELAHNRDEDAMLNSRVSKLEDIFRREGSSSNKGSE